jgi:hypothetical protein
MMLFLKDFTKNAKVHYVAMLLMALIFGLFLIGCSSTPVVYKNASGYNSATLVFKGKGTSISQFDGEIVNWQAPSVGSLKVTVPSGSHTVLMIGTSGQEEITMNLDSSQNYEIIGNSDGLPSIKKVEAKITSSGSGQVWVSGYRRKNGTYVKGHYRKK